MGIVWIVYRRNDCAWGMMSVWGSVVGVSIEMGLPGSEENIPDILNLHLQL
jgi:hypothetical protein